MARLTQASVGSKHDRPDGLVRRCSLMPRPDHSSGHFKSLTLIFNCTSVCMGRVAIIHVNVDVMKEQESFIVNYYPVHQSTCRSCPEAYNHDPYESSRLRQFEGPEGLLYALVHSNSPHSPASTN